MCEKSRDRALVNLFNTFRPAFRKYNKKHEKRKMETKGARNLMIDSVGITTKTTLL